MPLRLAAVVLFLAWPMTGHPALIPYFRLDSLVLLSDVVVLCNEQSVVAPADWDGNTRVRCQVVQAFKGGLAPGARFGIVYDALYSRALPGDEGYTLMNAHHQVERVGFPRTFPPDAPCSSSSATPGLPPTPS